MIDITGVIISGLSAAIVFSIFTGMARAMGMTSMSIEKTLGAMIGEGSMATTAGWMMHFASGIVFAFIYVLVFNFTNSTNGWFDGAIIGLVHGVGVGAVMMPMIGMIHPAIRSGKMKAPGLFAKNAGPMTPLGLVVGHVLFGTVLGGIYFIIA